MSQNKPKRRRIPVRITLHPKLRSRAESLAEERYMSLTELVEDLLQLELRKFGIDPYVEETSLPSEGTSRAAPAAHRQGQV